MSDNDILSQLRENKQKGLLSVIAKLTSPTADVKFYESGSRAVAKRLGTDHLTSEMIDEAEKQVVAEYGKWHPNYKKPDPKSAKAWLGKKPITIETYTDHDFYCQHDAKHIAYLQAFGFVSTWYSTEDKGDSDYRDELCAAVFIHEDYEIQVVTRTDPLLYKAIFDNIPPDMYYDFLWKSSPTKPERTDIRRWFDTFAIISKAVQELK